MKTQQQGEVRIEMIDVLPDGLVPATEKDNAGRWIISHSEKGHHHVLPADVEVLERPMSDGLRQLYAIVKNPTAMTQSASVAHEAAEMPPGIYELTISREYDPFTQQASRVAD